MIDKGNGNEIKLDPCPFCGGEANIREEAAMDMKFYKVVCTHCFVNTMPSTGIIDSVRRWNRRYTADGDHSATVSE